MKFDRHLGISAVEVPVESDWKSLNLNFTALRLHEILQ